MGTKKQKTKKKPDYVYEQVFRYFIHQMQPKLETGLQLKRAPTECQELQKREGGVRIYELYREDKYVSLLS